MLRAVGISKCYYRKTGEANFFHAVKSVDIELKKGTVTVITGRSGSGKTTLLHMLSGLLVPSEGKVMLGDTDMYSLNDVEASKLRRSRIAVIPQVNAAVRSLSVMENILIQSRMAGAYDSHVLKRAMDLSKLLDIDDLSDSMPDELSGGEKRRMSIVRALVSGADIVLADEPTGDLDNENTWKVLQLLHETAMNGAAVLCVTHEQQVEYRADRVFEMDAGKLNIIR